MRSLAGLAASARPAPALDSLVHPVPLAALTLMLLNDHVLKASDPGWLTGKLSDVAGLMLLPFVLLAGWDLVRLIRPSLPASGPRLAVASATLAVILFTAMKVVPLGSDLYRLGLGGVQWPFRALVAWVASEPSPSYAQVHLTSDPSDLLTLPVALAVLAVRPWSKRATA
jgi:hypothetical protein